MNEQIFRYGESGQGIGITCLPESIDDAPVLVLLNAGLLHREQPYRLNVVVSRALANLGYICIRVDLSGKGDTPERPGISNRESVALDWGHIKKSIANQFGERTILILGLCSGADNAIKLAAEDSDVRGLVLLDPVTPADPGFRIRRMRMKLRNIHVWRRRLSKIADFWRFMSNEATAEKGTISLRDTPTDDDLRMCLESIVERRGKMLAILTSLALPYYNDPGQLARSSGITGLDEYCTEIFWPHMGHLFPVQHHRDLLVRTITEWAAENLENFKLVDLSK